MMGNSRSNRLEMLSGLGKEDSFYNAGEME